MTYGDPRTDQKSAGGRPLPKSKRQELGIFHCEELSVELLLCDKNTIVLSVLKSNDVTLSVAHVLTGSVSSPHACQTNEQGFRFSFLGGEIPREILIKMYL